MVALPEKLKEKNEIVKKYKIGAGKFKDGTPEYVREYHKEILAYYERELSYRDVD